MFVGVMGLRTHRRWDHSGLSDQGAVICWFYRIWSQVGGERGVWEVIELPAISWDFPAEVRESVWERQKADNLQAGSQVTYCNLFCRICPTEERCTEQSKIWELDDDLEFTVWYTTVRHHFPLLSIMNLSFTVFLRVVPQDNINADLLPRNST